jgi:hypothetical protein
MEKYRILWLVVVVSSSALVKTDEGVGDGDGDGDYCRVPTKIIVKWVECDPYISRAENSESNSTDVHVKGITSITFIMFLLPRFKHDLKQVTLNSPVKANFESFHFSLHFNNYLKMVIFFKAIYSVLILPRRKGSYFADMHIELIKIFRFDC